MTGYANWQSDEVESLVFVGSTPTSVTELVPWSSGEDAWPTSRKRMVRLHPGSLISEQDGLMVQREGIAFAWRKSEFDSRWVH